MQLYAILKQWYLSSSSIFWPLANEDFKWIGQETSGKLRIFLGKDSRNPRTNRQTGMMQAYSLS